MKRLIFLAPLLLAACAITGTKIQTECEEKYSEFVDILNCTHNRILAEAPSRLDPPQAKLYMLIGQQLAELVKAGQMSSIDAKVEWAKAYLEMQRVYDADAQQRAAAAANMIKAQSAATVQPLYQPVQPARPLTTSCTTKNVLGALQTNCTSQ